MRILFDNNVPVGLRLHFPDHDVTTAAERGWRELVNGRLLSAAEQAGIDVMVTCDRNIAFQQNLAGRSLGLVVLSTTAWPIIRNSVPPVITAVNRAGPGSYEEVVFARAPLRRRPFTP